MDAKALIAGAILVAGGVMGTIGCDPLIPIELPTDIRSELEGKTAAEKANIKGEALASRKACGSHTDKASGITMEITGIEKIEGGVQVFAKAWKDGEQLGFGEDGSVEIERFRIFNPPILVPDENGTIISEYTSETTGKHHVFRYREDPTEALRQVVAQIAGEVGKKGTQIEEGKVGRTTSTFYPDASPETTSVDGYVTQRGGTYATVQADTVGDTANDSGTGAEVNNLKTGATYYVYRAFFLFDTSSIPDSDTISSAVFSAYGFSVGNADSDSMSVVASTPASNTALVLADFDQVGTTKFATDIPLGSWNTAGYNDFTLNGSGVAAVTKTGISKFALRMAKDISATQPTGLNYAEMYMAEQSGTTNDPKLVVVHAAGSVPGDDFFFVSW